MIPVADCWASSGHGSEACQGLEHQLKACMDAPVRIILQFHGRGLIRANCVFRCIQKDKTIKKNTINYHLMRMFERVAGPRKREGRLG